MTVKISGNSSSSTPSFAGDDGDSGLHATADQVQLVTNGTVAMTVDSSQNIGIGTTTPANALDIVKTVSGSTTTARIASTATSGSNNANLILNNGGSGNSTIRFDYEGSTDFASIGTTASNKNIVFSTNSLPRATIDSSGRVGVGTSSPGTIFNIRTDASDDGILLEKNDGTDVARLFFDATSSDARLDMFSGGIAKIQLRANGNSHISGRLLVGTDTSTAGRFELSQTGNDVAARINIDTASAVCLDGRYTGTTGTVYFGRWIYNGSTVGGITSSGSSTAYLTTSDYRLKENVATLTGAVDRVNQLQVHRFNFIADPDTTVDGFIAHEAQVVVPECVTGTKDEVDENGDPVYQGIDQSKLVPLLTAALQEALQKIETLETQNAEQATTIASFEARISALEGGN